MPSHENTDTLTYLLLGICVLLTLVGLGGAAAGISDAQALLYWPVALLVLGAVSPLVRGR